MSTALESPQSGNPFKSSQEFSQECVNLMRAMSKHRKSTGQQQSSPEEVLRVLAELGYRQPADAELAASKEADRFVAAMESWQESRNIAFPTCEDLLNVIDSLGYHRTPEEGQTATAGLPIDRRRREPDERANPDERRASSEPSPQERLDLSDDEHAVLDALKELRELTGREFASSEELLSIVWDLGYRPLGSDGVPVGWLDEQDRCATQMRFTNEIEARLAAAADGDYLTCRSLLHAVAEIGFVKQ